MKIMLVAAALVAGLVSVPAQAATPGPTAAAPAAIWAQDGFGPGNTGYNPGESVVNAGTIKKLRPRWTIRPRDASPGCQPLARTPIVVDGRAYVLEGDGVAAYHTGTGKRLWLNEEFSFISAGLVAADGMIIVNSTNCYSQSNYDGAVVALDAKTGATRWRESQSWMIDTVVADRGAVVVSGYCGTCDDAPHGVVAFRTADGFQLWQHPNAVLAGPVAAGGRVMLRSTTRPESSVVDLQTGNPLWGTGSLWSARAANPAGDQFYLWNSVGLSAVRAATAKTLWRVRGEAGDLASDGRRVFVASANRVNAYHATTGRLEWTRAVATPKRPIRAGGLLYVQSKRSLVILSPINGKPVASGVPFGTISDHVVATGGRLYATSGRTVRTYTP